MRVSNDFDPPVSWPSNFELTIFVEEIDQVVIDHLVVDVSEKYEFVHGKDDRPDMENNKCSKPPTSL